MAAGDVSAAKAEAYTRTAGTNRLASVATTGAASGSRSFIQDARGNQSSESRNISGSLTSIAASYDGHGRLISYATGASPALNFAYNGLGLLESVDHERSTAEIAHLTFASLLNQAHITSAIISIGLEHSHSIWLISPIECAACALHKSRFSVTLRLTFPAPE